MLIVFSNQKGGVGKSTLAVLFSDFLGMRNIRCRVLDCDPQATILNIYANDLTKEGIPHDFHGMLTGKVKVPFNKSSYFRIERTPFDLLSSLIRRYIQSGETFFHDDEYDVTVIDLPGSLQKEEMEPIFKLADVIITPSSFTKVDNDSTVAFAAILDAMNVRAKKFIIPNSIPVGAILPQREEAGKTLLNLGYTITPDIVRTINLARGISSMYISFNAQLAVESAFTFILKKINLV
ncbi:ParA family protein [Parabacteroides merdae]|uniref:ParA family protein n=3 Tax=Parabacteroides merdae TaxID=46503 RepID=UPI0034A28AC0